MLELWDTAGSSGGSKDQQGPGLPEASFAVWVLEAPPGGAQQGFLEAVVMASEVEAGLGVLQQDRVAVELEVEAGLGV